MGAVPAVRCAGLRCFCGEPCCGAAVCGAPFAVLRCRPGCGGRPRCRCGVRRCGPVAVCGAAAGLCGAAVCGVAVGCGAPVAELVCGAAAVGCGLAVAVGAADAAVRLRRVLRCCGVRWPACGAVAGLRCPPHAVRLVRRRRAAGCGAVRDAHRMRCRVGLRICGVWCGGPQCGGLVRCGGACGGRVVRRHPAGFVRCCGAAPAAGCGGVVRCGGGPYFGCGAVRCGPVRCGGSVRCGAVRCGVRSRRRPVRCGGRRCGLRPYGGRFAVWCGAVRCGAAGTTRAQRDVRRPYGADRTGGSPDRCGGGALRTTIGADLR